MKLPFAAKARVDRRKIVNYLLSPSHPDGASKAKFFTSFAFQLKSMADSRAGIEEAWDGRRSEFFRGIEIRYTL
jgi:hypothetical protein